MRRIVYLIGIICLICFACKKPSKDNLALPINDMKKVMWDMMKVDEWVVQTNIMDTLHVRAKENIQLYEQVFSIHKISRKRYYNSYNYYQTHPDKFKILMDSITALANRENALKETLLVK